MIRTQLYIPEKAHAKLNYLAAIRKEPVAQIVRGYVEEGLKRDETAITGNAEALLELAELAEQEGWSGPSDLAQKHTTYLA